MGTAACSPIQSLKSGVGPLVAPETDALEAVLFLARKVLVNIKKATASLPFPSTPTYLGFPRRWLLGPAQPLSSFAEAGGLRKNLGGESMRVSCQQGSDHHFAIWPVEPRTETDGPARSSLADRRIPIPIQVQIDPRSPCHRRRRILLRGPRSTQPGPPRATRPGLSPSSPSSTPSRSPSFRSACMPGPSLSGRLARTMSSWSCLRYGLLSPGVPWVDLMQQLARPCFVASMRQLTANRGGSCVR